MISGATRERARPCAANPCFPAADCGEDGLFQNAQRSVDHARCLRGAPRLRIGAAGLHSVSPSCSPRVCKPTQGCEPRRRAFRQARSKVKEDRRADRMLTFPQARERKTREAGRVAKDQIGHPKRKRRITHGDEVLRIKYSVAFGRSLQASDGSGGNDAGGIG